uniref:Uncharacterized protein n=1 Tax=viral metagenome TaxID=1070528 RepID=A0A6C0DQJ7_9ZZZZ
MSNNNRLIGYNNESLDSTNFLISYNKNDFWYNSTDAAIINNLPTLADCSLNNIDDKSWDDVKCSKNNVSSNNQDCVRRELCLNRRYGEQLMTLQNNHVGADQNYLDTKNKYYYQYLQSINLGVGIIGGIYIIYTLYKNRNIV